MTCAECRHMLKDVPFIGDRCLRFPHWEPRSASDPACGEFSTIPAQISPIDDTETVKPKSKRKVKA